MLQADSDRYFYEPIKKGVSLRFPPEIAAGLNDVSKRGEWNKSAPHEYALPTEIWREVVMRRQYSEEVRSKLATGQVRSINDLITYNLDIRQFAQDVIETSEGPELVRAFYKAIKTVSVLDPACGSGAFLFAALNILEPLYEACLDRMQVFLDELEQSKEKHRPEKFADFKTELELVAAHPNRKYFIYKTIIVNNLFGVDIMEEATEICKLRLFLKLVAQIERTDQIEPLPDIDFNIRAGNSLVGYASYDHVKHAVTSKLDFEKTMERIEEKAQEIDRLFKLFREMQSDQRMEANEFGDAKQELLRRLRTLEEELNRYLAGEYGIKASDRTSYDKWLDSHKPFHWFIEFYGIVKDGGFSVVIGNPPWREYSVAKKEYTVRGYATQTCGNLHGIFSERALSLRSADGDMSFIVQLPLTNSSRMSPVRSLLREKSGFLHICPFDDRPGKLFEGLQNCRSVIFVSRGRPQDGNLLFTSKYQRWSSDTRDILFPQLRHTLVRDERLYPDLFPKFPCRTAQSVFQKVANKSKNVVGMALVHHVTDDFIFYQEATRYWVKAAVGLPYYAKNGHVGAPAHGRYLYFDSSDSLYPVFGLLNSSLFYIYFIVFGDCFHLSDGLVSGFPIPPDLCQHKALSKLGRQLAEDLHVNAERKSIETKDGDKISYEEFYGSRSKIIIDKIDFTLSNIYGLSAEETDFVCNYDIKFRTGNSLEEADD